MGLWSPQKRPQRPSCLLYCVEKSFHRPFYEKILFYTMNTYYSHWLEGPASLLMALGDRLPTILLSGILASALISPGAGCSLPSYQPGALFMSLSCVHRKDHDIRLFQSGLPGDRGSLLVAVPHRETLHPVVPQFPHL